MPRVGTEAKVGLLFSNITLLACRPSLQRSCSLLYAIIIIQHEYKLMNMNMNMN